MCPSRASYNSPASFDFYFLPRFFHGFFLSAYYTSNLGSILTVNLFHAQINTMNDIVSAQLPVMIIDYEMEFLLNLNKELPQEFWSFYAPWIRQYSRSTKQVSIAPLPISSQRITGSSSTNSRNI